MSLLSFLLGEKKKTAAVAKEGGALVEPWLPGSRAASLRERLVAVRRLEDR